MKVNRVMSLLLSCSSLGLALPALAQESARPGDEASREAEDAGPDIEKDIVVTGTLLRGIAPVGSATVGLDSAEIAATGATTTNDLLATHPPNLELWSKEHAGRQHDRRFERPDRSVFSGDAAEPA